MENEVEDWRELCKLAEKELDPAKLLALTKRISELMDEEEKRKNKDAAA